MKRSALILVLLTAVWLPTTAQADVAVGAPQGDLLDVGLWWLYQLQYEKARENFTKYTSLHPEAPAGYFYKTAADWWQLAQEFDYDLPKVQKHLEEDYQDTLRTSKALLESAKTPQESALAFLYMGGAEGLKGRWLVTQKQWVKAYFAGKRGNSLLKKALAHDPELYDAYLGLGIYDYFTDTLPGVQGVLAGLLIHGDRKRGLKELQWAIEKSHHARVEAQFFLIEIYTFEENAPAKARQLAHDLRKEFPQSPAMHLAEVMALYQMKDWDTMAMEAKNFLEKSEREVPYYPHHGVRPGLYCLGVQALYGKHDPDACIRYMKQILDQGIDSNRWVTYAFTRMGQAYDAKGDREKALENYKKALSRKDIWGSHRDAEQYLKVPYKF